MYVRDNVVSAKCFSGKCNFWKVFFGEVYRIRSFIVAKEKRKFWALFYADCPTIQKDYNSLHDIKT